MKRKPDHFVRNVLLGFGTLVVVVFGGMFYLDYHYFSHLEDETGSHYIWVVPSTGQVQENWSVFTATKSYWTFLTTRSCGASKTESRMLSVAFAGVQKCTDGMKVEDWGGISITDSRQVQAFKSCLEKFPPPVPVEYRSNTFKLEIPWHILDIKCQDGDEDCKFKRQQAMTCWNRKHAGSDWNEPLETRGITCYDQ